MLHAFVCGSPENLPRFPGETVPVVTDYESLAGKRILFIVPLPAHGVNPAVYELLAYLRSHPHCLKGCVGGVWIHCRERETPDGGSTEEYVKALLGVPANFRVLAMFCFGVPAVHSAPYELDQLQTGKVHYGKF